MSFSCARRQKDTHRCPPSSSSSDRLLLPPLHFRCRFSLSWGGEGAGRQKKRCPPCHPRRRFPRGWTAPMSSPATQRRFLDARQRGWVGRRTADWQAALASWGGWRDDEEEEGPVIPGTAPLIGGGELRLRRAEEGPPFLTATSGPVQAVFEVDGTNAQRGRREIALLITFRRRDLLCSVSFCFARRSLSAVDEKGTPSFWLLIVQEEPAEGGGRRERWRQHRRRGGSEGGREGGGEKGGPTLDGGRDWPTHQHQHHGERQTCSSCSQLLQPPPVHRRNRPPCVFLLQTCER